ncbi:GNAT family N-acetyltransferase [Streptomyces sp. NBC_01217]|uniref:GNAT family N-acetyltransferase n=1 Tax=Streptomyces sp. NBC_01217 TaxID=2903779 RepID=UPI002E1096DE|nr:GNAT family N-acetyltransferase [Streptomyces sp. NBC_01217]
MSSLTPATPGTGGRSERPCASYRVVQAVDETSQPCPARGLGYAREAVAAFVDWALENVLSDNLLVIAVTQEANVRSRRLLHRVGSAPGAKAPGALRWRRGPARVHR